MDTILSDLWDQLQLNSELVLGVATSYFKRNLKKNQRGRDMQKKLQTTPHISWKEGRKLVHH